MESCQGRREYPHHGKWLGICFRDPMTSVDKSALRLRLWLYLDADQAPSPRLSQRSFWSLGGMKSEY
jgi:hypothetical protein